MPHNIADRVFELTTTAGLGDITPTGAVTGYSSFGGSFANGDMVFYMLDNLKQGGAEWEIGFSTFNGVDILRNGTQTLISSSSGGVAVNFAAGEKSVRVVAPADFLEGIWETHIGATAPIWFKTGTLWTDNSAAPQYCLRQWDGSNWRSLFCYNASGIIISASQITGTIPASLISGSLPTSQISGKLPASQVSGNSGEIIVFDASGCGQSSPMPVYAIDELTDVDTTTNAPSIGSILEWDGTNYVPSILPLSQFLEASSNVTESYTVANWNATDTNITFTNTKSLFFVYAYANTSGGNECYLGIEIDGTVYPLTGGTTTNSNVDRGLKGAGRYINLPAGTYTANIVVFPDSSTAVGSSPLGSPPGVDNRYMQIIYS